MLIGTPCDKDGNLLLDPTLPPSLKTRDPTDWRPFKDQIAFEAAEWFYKSNQTSASGIDEILRIWAASLAKHEDAAPFTDHTDLYQAIDDISVDGGGVPWKSHSFEYTGPRPDDDAPKWMAAEHTIWYRDPRKLFLNMLDNPDFAKYFDYAPLRQYDVNDHRCYEDFMSGDWSWLQAVSCCFTSVSVLIFVT